MQGLEAVFKWSAAFPVVQLPQPAPITGCTCSGSGDKAKAELSLAADPGLGTSHLHLQLQGFPDSMAALNGRSSKACTAIQGLLFKVSVPAPGLTAQAAEEVNAAIRSGRAAPALAAGFCHNVAGSPRDCLDYLLLDRVQHAGGRPEDLAAPEETARALPAVRGELNSTH